MAADVHTLHLDGVRYDYDTAMADPVLKARYDYLSADPEGRKLQNLETQLRRAQSRGLTERIPGLEAEIAKEQELRGIYLQSEGSQAPNPSQITASAYDPNTDPNRLGQLAAIQSGTQPTNQEPSSSGYITANDYFWRPGETTEQYNARIEGLRSSGKTTDPTLIGMTPDQIQKTYLSGQQPGINTQTISPKDFNTEYSTTSLSDDSSTFQDVLLGLQENEKIRQKELKKAQQTYLDTISKSQDQLSIEDQLADIRDKGNKSLLGLENQAVPTPFIVGQQREQAKLFQAEEQNLINRLGLAQEAQKMKQDQAGAQLDFLLQNQELAMAAEDRIFERQQAYFDQAMQLDDRARNQLADILDILQGSDPKQWDAQTQAKVAQIAASRGLSYSMVAEGLQSVYDQQVFENVLKQRQEARLGGEEDDGGGESFGTFNEWVSQMKVTLSNPIPGETQEDKAERGFLLRDITNNPEMFRSEYEKAKSQTITSGVKFTDQEKKKLEQAGLLGATRQEKLDYLYGGSDFNFDTL